jgi:hypothetical protein
MAQLREAGAGGGVDKLRAAIKKAQSSIEKAQSAVLDAADELDELLVQSTAMGGFVATTLPSHVKMHIATLTGIAEKELGDITNGDNQSSLKKIEELINNTPLGKFDSGDAESRRQQISMQPNLTQGPQSSISQKRESEDWKGASNFIRGQALYNGDVNDDEISESDFQKLEKDDPAEAQKLWKSGRKIRVKESESLEDFYRNILRESAKNVDYDETSLSFDALKESDVFGQHFEEDMMDSVNMKIAKPIQSKRITEQMRAAVDDQMFEQFDGEQGEQLVEGKLDFNRLRPFAGKDGMPLSFSSLREGEINMVDNT